MLLIMSAIVASTLSDPIHTGPLCSAPPKGASDSCVECYEDACIDYIEAWYGCDGNQDCRNQARRAYRVMLQICDCGKEVSPVLLVLNSAQARDFSQILGSLIE